MIIKAEDFDALRQAGSINGQVLGALRDAAQPGTQTIELDRLAHRMIKAAGGEAPFLGYPAGGAHPYPATINVSVNEQLVHGIPGHRALQDGDIVTLDCGTSYEGMIVDSAITVMVGRVSSQVRQLIRATEIALETAISMLKPGRHLSDISFTIYDILQKFDLSVPYQYGGHGVGYALHCPPHVANWGLPGRGPILQPGMALAIEPMGMLGHYDTQLMPDYWTVVATDNSLCAHTEHTVLITDDGAEVLTPVPQTTC